MFTISWLGALKIGPKFFNLFKNIYDNRGFDKGQDFVSMDFVYKNFRLFSITDKGVKYLRKITR